MKDYLQMIVDTCKKYHNEKATWRCTGCPFDVVDGDPDETLNCETGCYPWKHTDMDKVKEILDDG